VKKSRRGTDKRSPDSSDVVHLAVRVQARASRSGIQGVSDSCLHVRTMAVPADGAANRDVIRQLARAFGVPKSNVTLLRGASSRHKLFRIEKPRKHPDWMDELN
jgi:hypothetical protein